MFFPILRFGLLLKKPQKNETNLHRQAEMHWFSWVLSEVYLLQFYVLFKQMYI